MFSGMQTIKVGDKVTGYDYDNEREWSAVVIEWWSDERSGIIEFADGTLDTVDAHQLSPVCICD